MVRFVVAGWLVKGLLGLVPSAGPLLLVEGQALAGEWARLVGEGWWARLGVLHPGLPTFAPARKVEIWVTSP
jgi:hypothetical protein